MTLDLLQAIDELVPSAPRSGDWQDVLARAAVSRGNPPYVESALPREPRARRLSRKRIALVLVAAAVLAFLAAPALGLAPPFLDFFSSRHAPKRDVRNFELLNVTAPRGMSPKVIVGESRLVTTYHLRDGTPFPLVVAPTRTHDFCFTIGFGGGCAPHRVPPRHDQPGDRNAQEIGIGSYGSHVLAGYVIDQRIARIEIRFKHAAPANVPLLWISPPIDAGFFLYDIPRKLRAPNTGPVAVVALDARGRELGRNGSLFRPRPVWFNPAAVSDRSKRHTILRSGRLSIVIAPSRTGGNCFWLKVDTYQEAGGGCTPPRYLTEAMAGGLNHGTGFTGFSAHLRPSVSRVELRFEDGARVSLQPVQGFVLYDIPATHWPRQHRLRLALAYSGGKIVARQSFDTLQTGVYDCAKKVPIGAGETACP